MSLRHVLELAGLVGALGSADDQATLSANEESHTLQGPLLA